MIEYKDNWKNFIVKNQTHYNSTNELRFNLVQLMTTERGWTELFQEYPPVISSGGAGTSPINGRSYSWTYGFIPVGYFGVKNGSQVFTADGTWTCPAGVNEIYVRCIGKGGDGGDGAGGGASGVNLSRGGGGGGFIMAKIQVVPGKAYAVAVSSTASFGGLLSATKGGNNGGAGGSYTSKGEADGVEVLFKGRGGQASGYGGAAGGAEMGNGANAEGSGGSGLKGIAKSIGGGGMITDNPTINGAGFKASNFSGDYGGGMFSNSCGLKSPTHPYYSLLSTDITVDLGNWGAPGGYGGGTSYIYGETGNMFSGGRAYYRSTDKNAIIGDGGFGGGGAVGAFVYMTADDSYTIRGGAGGYGGGGGVGGSGGNYKGNPRIGISGSRGGNGGSGGGGGAGGSGYKTTLPDGSSTVNAYGGSGGNGGNGGYGGGGGVGGNYGEGTLGNGRAGKGGKGGAALVIIEW